MGVWTQDFLGPLVIDSSGTYRLETAKFDNEAGTAALTVLVAAGSADALTLAIEALVAQLVVGNSYVHYPPGATNPVVYRISGVSGIQLGDVGWVANWQSVSFLLALAGQPAGALTTLYNAQAVSVPASVSLAALLGTRPTTLDVMIDDASGNDFHSVWAALAPTALTDAKWYVLASALTWTTMSNGTGATMWGNSERHTTSASYQTAPLDTSQYPAGKYRLLVRASQSAGTGYVMDSQNAAPIAITRTTQNLQVVGDVDLPVQDTPWGTAANLTLSVKSDGTNTLTVNAFLLLPLDLGYFSWHDTDVVTNEIDELDVGPTGTFMYDVTTNLGATDMAYLLGSPLTPSLLAAHTGTLIATASPTGNSWPSDWTADANATADTSRFKLVAPGGAAALCHYAPTSTRLLVVSGAWYQFDFTRQVTAYTSGNSTMYVNWMDIDGNNVRYDTLDTRAATDASPVPLTYYSRAPVNAVRATVYFGSPGVATFTAYYSAVAMRRCPLKLLLAAEDAAGALTSNATPVTLTVKYTARQEIAR